MHTSLRQWIESAGTSYADYGFSYNRRTIEIGSMDINGTVRDLFSNYRGLDIAKGPNVDIVSDPNRYCVTSGSYEQALCLEVIEHVQRPWLVLSEIRRILVARGRLLLSCPAFSQVGFYPYHDYPGDYWRYSYEGLWCLLVDNGFEIIDEQWNNGGLGLVAFCRKAP